MPSASAASVPGRMGIHSSHCSAVRVRIGSMQMSGAPRLRASRMNGQRCGFAVRVFVPQSRIRSASGTPSVSAPRFAPTVMRIPVAPASAQIVRASREAPMWWKSRRSIDDPCTSPMVPAYE